MTKIFGIKTNNIQGNKKTISSFTLILILAISMIIVFAQPTFAQVGIQQPEKTTGYIDVAPRLLGVGQQATVNLFVYPIPTNLAYQPYYDGYRGVTVTFIKPDGSKDSFKPVDGTNVYDAGQTQALGAIYFFYKPDQVGNWSVSFTMPDQNLTDVTGTVLMKGCTSEPAYFTVQTDPVLAGLLNGYPWAPLPNPNTYWSYPINSNNREWNQISGDWLGMASTGAIVNNPTARLWQPYGSGPSAGHIVWKTPIRMGGLVGGQYGSISYGALNSRISNVIIDGKVFQNIEYTNTFECIDLATGKVLYTANGQIDYGIHLYMNAYTQSGYSPTGNVVLESSYGSTPVAYLIGGTGGSNWTLYDPLTGTLVRSIVNASSGFKFIDGSELAYGVRNNNLVRWNMTRVVNNNWPTGIEWQKPLPKSLVDALPLDPIARSNVLTKAVLAISSDASTIVVKATSQFWGYSTTDGTSLWNMTLNYPITANEEIFSYPADNFIILDPTESTFKAYSITTGSLLWTSTSFSDNTWATTWTVYLSSTNDNDNFYAQFSDCTVRAYSLKDGHEIWRSKPIASTEYPNNVVPYVQSMVMVGGKIYAYAGYSSSYKINPIPRFAMVVVIDATNGDTLYTLNGGIRVSAAANGYVIGTGDNDGNLWAIGKGPTSTTVTAQQQLDGSALIQGSIIDMSPAAQEYASKALFANGVPAVSDADMSEWMDYLYMQNATLQNNPPTPKGVTVKVSALDSKGQVTDLGTTTSDYAGQFVLSWKPTTEGTYKIFATFDGSNSYYSSYAETAVSIGKAPTETSNQPQQTIPDYTMTIIIAAIAIIIAVAIVGIILYRKK